MAKAQFSGLILVLALLGPAHAAGPLDTAPNWSAMSAQEQRALAPLAAEWDTLDGTRKTKWLGLARRFPSMTPQEQERVQARMTDWAKLTPEQRNKARDQYRSMRKSPPEEREALKQRWQEYENLSPEERQRITDKAAQPANRRPGKPSPATGAARP
ncbi:MAG: DUF3106 domain-containing protein [Sterolibacteriaceae bacterium]|jgi:hypothetical protein|nr:DUF3106 domain-containing protein [Sterolibacteriaceae bacterium]MBK9084045.1 DUF3106 domain-containing protein [Sterolibacteriaceae bacterium]